MDNLKIILLVILNILYWDCYAGDISLSKFKITSVKPSSYLCPDDGLCQPVLKQSSEPIAEFLEHNKDKSLSAKFLLSTTSFYDSEKFLTGLKHNEPMLKAMITREINRPSDTFVFYSAAGNAVKFLRMVMTSVSKILGSSDRRRQIILSDLNNSILTPQKFLETYLDIDPRQYKLHSSYDGHTTFDHKIEVRKELLAASMLLHDGRFGETAWTIYTKNRSLAVQGGKEREFLNSVLVPFFQKLGYQDFPIETLVDLFTKFQANLKPQLLQIFINKSAFNQLGYYCYSGGDPVVSDSSAFLEEFYDALMKNSVNNWENTFDEMLRKNYVERKLYHLANRVVFDLKINSDGWPDGMQVRFIASNPAFYDPQYVRINEYYNTDEDYAASKELKHTIQTLLSTYLIKRVRA